MQETRAAVKPGDWIRITPLWPGIWRVYQVISGFVENRYGLEEPKVKSTRTLVRCHRVVNDSWQRSFSHQGCEGGLTSALEPDDISKLQALLSADQKLRKAFEKYQAATEPHNLSTNLTFGGLSEPTEKEFPALSHTMLANRIDGGLSLYEILMQLRVHGLDRLMHTYPTQARLQLVSIGQELRNNEFLYRSYKTFPF